LNSNLIAAGTSLAYASFGRWVAECSNPHCDSAVDDETQLWKFAPGFQCVECGHKTEVIWPAAEMVYGVERLLLLRPARKYQNWFPGETLTELQMENTLHGIYDFLELEAAPGTTLMSVTDTELRVDMLPVLNPRRELRAVER
jgi:Zn ribbon nucleic-acid-binding protein